MVAEVAKVYPTTRGIAISFRIQLNKDENLSNKGVKHVQAHTLSTPVSTPVSTQKALIKSFI